MSTPRHRATLWISANVAWFSGLPAFSWYLSRQLAGGALSADADSIGLPFFTAVILAILGAPVLNLIWWWLSRTYPGSVPLFTRGHNSPVAHLLIVLTMFLLIGAIWEFVAGAPEVGLVVLVWSYIALASRAAHLHSNARSAVAI